MSKEKPPVGTFVTWRVIQQNIELTGIVVMRPMWAVDPPDEKAVFVQLNWSVATLLIPLFELEWE